MSRTATRRTAATPRAAALALVAIASIIATVLVVPPRPASAAVPELQGHDVSWPQCPAGSGTKIPGTPYGVGFGNPMPPESTDFVIIGLTDGLPFYRNHCLASQVDYVRGLGLAAGAYTMAAYPTSSQLTTYGAKGPRSATTLAGKLYNTGYAMAQFDLASLKAVGLSVPWVWIDVESRSAPTPPNWPSSNATNNRTVLQGIAAGFAAAGIKTGWYSVQSSWTNITGGWQDKAPMWKAGNYDTSVTGYARARSICSTSSLNGGPIYLAQALWESSAGAYDLDVTCPALPSYATVFRPAPAFTALSASSTWAQLGDVALTYRATLAARQDWSATLVDVCAGTTVRSWSGRGVGTVTLTWDGTTSGGATAPVGLYDLRFTSLSTTRTALAEVTAAGTTVVDRCSYRRTWGASQWDTAVAVGRQAAPTATTVVIASATPGHRVDGIVAAPLARRLNAPVLLTDTSYLPAATSAELLARRATKVIVIGGPYAVAPAVVDQLTATGATVERVYGVDAPATSVAVAQRLKALGGVTDGVALIGSYAENHMVDALAAGGVAAPLGRPILLTGHDALSPVVAKALPGLNIRRTFVLGGTSALGNGVLVGLPSPTRLWGQQASDTSVAIAREFWTPGQAVIVSYDASHLVDGLAAGTLARPTLLVQTASAPTPVLSWLSTTRPTQAWVVGGPLAVRPAVVRSVSTALR